jgi:acyl-CoA synthetase (AMP-forming)/AMP-acid ligase II
MGLFGHLSQILNGAESHVFEPSTFLRRPTKLLRYMAAHRATVLTGADFAYELLTDATPPELIRDLDLSSWRLAFNGAEPVTAATVRRFEKAFEPAGVRSTVMYPVYGMAEATLPITFPKPGTAPRLINVDRDVLIATGQAYPVAEDHCRAKTFVSVGAPVAGAHVRLVGESGLVLGPEILGEVQVAGGMVTSGYLGDPLATAAAFDGSWLRTGDLAFRSGDDYFVAGRRKEMVVVRGQNFFPEDAEAAARVVPGVYRQHVVAAAESDAAGGEFITVIAETELRDDAQKALQREIREQVVAEMGMPHVRVHLVDPRWLTRTTSGKWQRLLAVSRLRKEERG